MLRFNNFKEKPYNVSLTADNFYYYLYTDDFFNGVPPSEIVRNITYLNRSDYLFIKSVDLQDESTFSDYKVYDCKHIRQMSSDEIKYLQHKLRLGVNRNISFSEHAMDALRCRNISHKKVLDTFDLAQILEFRRYYTDLGKVHDERITLRSTAVFDNKYIYIVYSLFKNYIITIFDGHTSFVRYPYDPNNIKYKNNIKIGQ